MTSNDNGPDADDVGPDLFSPDLTTEEQDTALEIARHLTQVAVPIFVAKPDMTGGEWNPVGGHKNSGYWLPRGWNTLDAVHGQEARLKAYRPGDALCALMGWTLDVIDIDPRNGGTDSIKNLPALSIIAEATTPNEGLHWFVRSMDVRSRDNVLPGIDVKAGTTTGMGRGFAWIAPTVRLSKSGQFRRYLWNGRPDLDRLNERVRPSQALKALVEANRQPVRRTAWEGPNATDDVVLRRARELAERVRFAAEGEGNTTLNEMAFKIGEYVGAGQLEMATASALLHDALDSWEYAAGDEQAQRACLERALEQGAGKPRAWTADVNVGGLDEWHPNEIPARSGGTERPLFDDLGPAPVDSDDDGDGEPDTYGAKGSDPGEPEETGQEESDDDSWQTIDLSGLDDDEENPPTMMPRSDGNICLLYPGLIHSIHGESESGKSWIAQAETVRLIKTGQHVLFIDFENDAKAVRGRFLALGATQAELKLIDYRNPDAKPKFGGKWWAHMFSGQFAMIVLDGVTDALGIFSMGTKDNDDISTFLRKFPRALARRTNAAVVMIDHVVKDKDSRGRWALGGQAKMAGLDGAAYMVEIKDEMGRGKVGRLTVKVAKDKPGYVRGATPAGAMDRNRLSPIAEFVLDASNATSDYIVARLDPPGGDPFGEPEEFDPGLELKILRALNDAGGSLASQQKVVLSLGESPGVRREVILETIKKLMDAGDVEIGEPDGRKARVHTVTEQGKTRLDI